MLDNHAEPPSPSIFNGVDALIDAALNLTTDVTTGRISIGKAPHHRHKESCQRLSAQPLGAFDGAALISSIYQKISANWDGATYHNGSVENWRLVPNTEIASENGSPEVCLERAIVRTFNLLQPETKNWFNQVPVASGLVHPTADRSRKIDLVHDLGDKIFEFIELKVRSDTPLYAAMEILKYGVVYAFCRQDARVPPSILKHRELLEAEHIHLRVLAPAVYYERYDLSWLEASLNSGLATFGVEHELKCGLDLRFDTFSLFEHAPVEWKSRP